MRLAFAKQTHISHPHFRLWITSLEEIEAFDSPARRMNIVGVVSGKPLQNSAYIYIRFNLRRYCIILDLSVRHFGIL